MADRHEEGSKGGDRSVALWALVSVLLTIWLVYTGLQGRHVAPSASANTEAPATNAP